MFPFINEKKIEIHDEKGDGQTEAIEGKVKFFFDSRFGE